MSVSKPKQLQPADQINTAFDELENAFADARKALARIEFLKDRLIKQIEAADDLQIFSEPAAAELFGVTERTFADYRRKHHFPHIAFGQQPKYTRQHLEQIARMLEIKTAAAGMKAA